MDIRNGNCLELLKTLPDKSVDLFICDLPYGETNCKWDTKIDMEEFWKEFKRVRKSKKTACIHFCSTKFGYSLIKSWESGFKMDMVWKKRNKTGGLQSRYRPMRNHEMVYFFHEQAPKYNRDEYHKRIKAKEPMVKDDEPANPASVVEEEEEKCLYGFNKKDKQDFQVKDLGKNHNFEPPNPASVVEEEEKKEERKSKADRSGMVGGGNMTGVYSKESIKKFLKENGVGFEPPNPTSVLEEEEEKDFLYGGDFYYKAKGNTQGTNAFEPPNPASVLEEEEEETDIYGETKAHMRARSKGRCHAYAFEPPNPASVVEEEEEKDGPYRFACKGKGLGGKKFQENLKNDGFKNGYTPPNPASVLEEEQDPNVNENGKSAHGWDITHMNKPRVAHFDPKLPLSVLENETDIYGETKEQRKKRRECDCNFEPPNPGSVFDSDKVFIGKRHHQTEKPQDILEFFLKYWTNEDDVVLDPTMGSGSTGVACKKLKRKFIGFELDPKIFETAKKRIEE
jgi:DNA modification methylase